MTGGHHIGPPRPYIPSNGERAARTSQFPRTRAQKLRIWWREIDRVMLALILVLMAIGAVAVAASSPSSARRLKVDDLHFFYLHLGFQTLGLMVMFVTSLMPREFLRRSVTLGGVAMVVLLMAVPVIGTEVNGARRWINLGIGFQPSEFLKPSFIVVVAWAFSEGARRKDVPGNLLALILFPLTIAPLILQPDFGQTMLISLVWGALFFIAGLHLFWVVGLGGVAAY